MSDLDPPAALARIAAAARQRDGRVDSGQIAALTISYGNRVIFRLLGAWGRYGERTLPYVVTVTATGSAPTSLHAQARSADGPALYRLQVATRLYERVVAQTLDQLQAAAAG